MMDDEQTTPPGVIRITPDEALSRHVDDLLERQMSLRGEVPGQRSRGRRWYYQNWFVFMVVAGLAALAAWAVLEPFFDDLQYIQGSVQRIDPQNVPRDIPMDGGQVYQIRVDTAGSFVVDDQEIWLPVETPVLGPDGGLSDLQPEDLLVGREVGVYVEYEIIAGQGIAIARVLVPDPPPQPATESALTLDEQYYQTAAAGFLLFAVVGGFIGLAIGGVDGLICRLLRRALLAGGIGLLVGFIGGFVSNIVANLAYAPLNHLAMEQAEGLNDLTAFGFAVQMTGRGFAWMLAGMTMGLGQGIALRSKRLLLYGLLGGIVGGLLGGLLFDPIDLLLLGGVKPSSHWSRLIGIVTVGLGVGAMIGVVELLARDAWLRMLEGPLAGKEFLIFKDLVNIGASPRADIYLFNDPSVAGLHATIRSVGDHYEIANLSNEDPAEVNGHQFQRTRLRHGDQITIGRTVFVFQQRQG